MKILVTGSAGFIGYHLAKKLLSEKNIVIGIDIINDYYDIRIKEKRNLELLKNKNYRFFKQDLINYELLDSIVKKEKPEVIVHLAAQAGVRYSLQNPWYYEQANGLGTMNIFEVARHNDINKVVFASSSSVYGGNKKLPFSEEDKTDTPVSLYAATKKANEVLAYSYHHLYGIKCVGLRFFTVYGPMGRPDMALFKFAKNIFLEKPIDVYNNGEMGRDFTYIDDIIKGILNCIKKEDLTYEIYNLGGDNPIKLNQFIELIEKNFGKKAIRNMLPMQPGDVKETYADISKAKNQLKYCPKTKIEEGVRIFCNWFKNNTDWLLELKNAKQ
jgi:UDP-glucuronate 4-epimerase